MKFPKNFQTEDSIKGCAMHNKSCRFRTDRKVLKIKTKCSWGCSESKNTFIVYLKRFMSAVIDVINKNQIDAKYRLIGSGTFAGDLRGITILNPWSNEIIFALSEFKVRLHQLNRFPLSEYFWIYSKICTT